MKESTLWAYIKKGLTKELGSKIALQRHEDISGAGIADVSYSMCRSRTRDEHGRDITWKEVNGWIELKSLDKWPVRASTPVRVPHLTPVQKHWLSTRADLGGHTWLLLRVEKEYFLFNARDIGFVGGLTRQGMKMLAIKYWSKSIDFKDLISVL